MKSKKTLYLKGVNNFLNKVKFVEETDSESDNKQAPKDSDERPALKKKETIVMADHHLTKKILKKQTESGIFGSELELNDKHYVCQHLKQAC